MRSAGIRVELDDRNEKLGYKIREAQMDKVPYMLIVGQKEKDENQVSVRSRDDGDLGSLDIHEFIQKVKSEVE